jgi:hypothetical protein
MFELLFGSRIRPIWPVIVVQRVRGNVEIAGAVGIAMSEGGSNPSLRQRRYGLRRFARNDEVGSSGATKQPDGQITKSLSSPSDKNIPLSPSGKSVI